VNSAVKTAKPRRWLRRLAIAGGVAGMACGAMWVALHAFPDFGPVMADGARKVFGPGAVAWVEDLVYGAEDQIHLAVRSEAPPTTYWEVPSPSAVPAVAVAVADEDSPPSFAAPHRKVAARGDGAWIPVRTSTDGARAVLYKTLVHPDPKRPYAVVAIVAMDLREIALEMVAGTEEPESTKVPRSHRPGVVPDADKPTVMAVFNGGFKAMHGNFGMRIGQDAFLPPREGSCTIALLPDADIEIRTFSAIEDDEPQMIAFRQTPPCLVERGEPNKRLLNEFTRNWGASVDGDTIIRRSAIGLSHDKRFLFYGLGDAVSARSIGDALLAAGAYDAAQLDVNSAYPRFMLVAHDPAGSLALTDPLIPGLHYKPTEYVVTPEPRDFFYIKRKPHDELSPRIQSSVAHPPALP
jgi:hypothetical protein